LGLFGTGQRTGIGSETVQRPFFAAKKRV